MMAAFLAPRRSRVCSIVLSNVVAIIAFAAFALWYGMNSDRDNIPPLLTQLLPAGHCACASSSLFNCSASPNPPSPDSSPVSLPPSYFPSAEWSFTYPRDRNNVGLSPAQCDAAFGGLFEDVHRAVHFWENDRNRLHTGLSTADLDAVPLGDGMVRAAIHRGQLYVLEARAAQDDHRRKIVAVLAAIHRALSAATVTTTTTTTTGNWSTSSSSSSSNGDHHHADLLARRNLQFIFSVEDRVQDVVNPANNPPLWVLGRRPSEQSVWLMPDFGFWSWENQFNSIGTFDGIVDRIVAREDEVAPWKRKKKKLVWRGKLSFAPKLRHMLLDVARNTLWGDVKELVWTRKDHFLNMEEHCDYMFVAHVEGRAFSSSLKYRQACHSVVVAHELQFIQHHHYLLQPSGPQQNFVQVHRNFSDLPAAMEELLDDPDRAKLIADNSVRTFRERHLTPAAEACYWRALFSGYAKVFKEEEDGVSQGGSAGEKRDRERGREREREPGDDLDDVGLRFESFILLPSEEMMHFTKRE